MQFNRFLPPKKFLLPIILGSTLVVLLLAGFFVWTKLNPPDKKNPELYLLNLSPDQWISTNKDNVAVSGVASDEGKIKEVIWKTKDGKTGSAEISGTQWTIKNIPLVKGDNQITIIATDSAGNTSSTAVNVVYNANVVFSDQTLSQDFIYKSDSKTTITVRSGVETTSGTALGEVSLYKISGDKKEKLTQLVDSGSVSDGDDIPGDTIYSGIHYFSSTSSEPILLRVGARLEKTDEVFYSGILKIQVINKPTFDQAANIFKLNKEFSDRFNSLKKSAGDKSAAKKLVEELGKRDEIAVAGVSEDGYGVWWKYKDSGILAGIKNSPEKTRADTNDLEKQREDSRAKEAQANTEQGSVAGISDFLPSPINFGVSIAQAAEEPKKLEVKSTKAIYLGPYLHQFGDTDDYHKAWKVIKDSKCPECQLTEQKDKEVTVEDFKTLSNYGLIVIPSHGDTWFNGTFAANCIDSGNCPEILKTGSGFVITWTDQQITANDLQKYWPDLVNYRLAIDASDGTLAVLPPYISAYNGTFPDSLVYIGTCRSTHNLTMAAAYLAKGAKGYLGFSEYVGWEYAGDVTQEMFKSFIEKGKSAGDSFKDAIAAKGANDGSNPPAFFNYVGQGDLKMGGKELQNAGFEDGLVGWQAGGDSRPISRLASLAPQEGKKMAIISTGLGSVSDSLSSLSQVICSKEGKASLSFKFNVISEEPMEYVGSKYDDYFVMTVDINGNKTTVVEKRINNSSWTAIGGINFAGGDSTTFMTGWATQTFDLGEIKKDDKVLIEFRVGDKGDSIYDTAALIDDVKLEFN